MNRSTKRSCILGWLTASTAVLLSSGRASAQDATVGVGATTTLPTRPRTSDPGEPRPIGATAAVPAANAHDMVVGHLGVGWLGTADVPVGPSSAAVGGTAPVPAPIVGVRYWLNSTFGVDAGLGFFTTSSATRLEQQGASTTEGPTRTAVVFHGGIPIALANTGNFSFQITPEVNVGIGTGGVRGSMGSPNTELSGFLLEAGARAGAEVFFGFIGLPQLSLEGGVGVFLSSESGKTSQGDSSTRFSRFMLSTSSVAQPWDIFRKDLAARYYF